MRACAACLRRIAQIQTHVEHSARVAPLGRAHKQDSVHYAGVRRRIIWQVCGSHLLYGLYVFVGRMSMCVCVILLGEARGPVFV